MKNKKSDIITWEKLTEQNWMSRKKLTRYGSFIYDRGGSEAQLGNHELVTLIW